MRTDARQRPAEPLVARTRELADLDQALDRLAAGQPGVVLLIGEPGIGKSRLLAESVRLAEGRGHLVLVGRAAEFEQDLPFGLIIDALNDYLGTLEPATSQGAGSQPIDTDSITPSALCWSSLPLASPCCSHWTMFTGPIQRRLM
jgi:AAA ATPase domain